jgi:hypothetical protein
MILIFVGNKVKDYSLKNEMVVVSFLRKFVTYLN